MILSLKVSIIIPTYNTERYILEAVHSCLAQTYLDFEIIIVDDGSTDKTIELLLKHEFGALVQNVSILMKPNGGTASALNMGIKNAKGEYIHWLSADDVLYPDALEKMMMIIDGHTDPESYIFYSNYDYIDEHSKKINQPFIEPNDNSIPKMDFDQKLWHHFIGNGTTSMIHRSIFESIGLYDETVGACEDYEFWMRAVLLKGLRLWLVPEITAHYRIHSQQLTQTLGQRGGEIVRNVRRLIWSKMTEAQRMIFANPN